jgi:hypothetical protein
VTRAGKKDEGKGDRGLQLDYIMMGLSRFKEGYVYPMMKD